MIFVLYWSVKKCRVFVKFNGIRTSWIFPAKTARRFRCLRYQVFATREAMSPGNEINVGFVLRCVMLGQTWNSKNCTLPSTDRSCLCTKVKILAPSVKKGNAWRTLDLREKKISITCADCRCFKRQVSLVTEIELESTNSTLCNVNRMLPTLYHHRSAVNSCLFYILPKDEHPFRTIGRPTQGPLSLRK